MVEIHLPPSLPSSFVDKGAASLSLKHMVNPELIASTPCLHPKTSRSTANPSPSTTPHGTTAHFAQLTHVPQATQPLNIYHHYPATLSSLPYSLPSCSRRPSSGSARVAGHSSGPCLVGLFWRLQAMQRESLCIMTCLTLIIFLCKFTACLLSLLSFLGQLM